MYFFSLLVCLRSTFNRKIVENRCFFMKGEAILRGPDSAHQRPLGIFDTLPQVTLIFETKMAARYSIKKLDLCHLTEK